MSRQETLTELKKFYIPERINEVDSDFSEFEEEMALEEDLGIMLSKCYDLFGESGWDHSSTNYWDNPHNSVLLYLLGLTAEFDKEKARADTVGGSPPDIDIDFDARERYKAINWVIEHWGRENVANIVTHGTLKPKSLARKYYSITEKPKSDLRDILKHIPDAKFGKEASFKKVFETTPALKSQEKYEGFVKAAEKLENLTSNFGVHAAGVVISDFPIWDLVPLWAKTESEPQENGRSKKVQRWITQFDMKEVEELGLIKFDFLSIDNLSIIKEAIKLLAAQGIEVDPYELPDGDERTYKMIAHGLLTGVFQMETSGSAKNLIADIQPTSIGELSDISALNRPGPMQANLDKMYIENKRNGYAPEDMPPALAKILEGTYWTLVYQEQVMRICTDLAGFTLQEADDVRRAMGKKKAEVLDKWRARFVRGIVDNAGLDSSFAESLWVLLAGDPKDLDNNGFADYCLAGDTEVLMPGGGSLRIEDIVKRNQPCMVVSHDGEERLFPRVTQWFDRGEQETFTYQLEDGRTVTCTPDHKFMTETGEMVTIEEAFERQLELKTT